MKEYTETSKERSEPLSGETSESLDCILTASSPLTPLTGVTSHVGVGDGIVVGRISVGDDRRAAVGEGRATVASPVVKT